MSGNQSPSQTTGAVASALAVLAVLAVLSAGVVAGVVGVGGASSADDPPSGTTTGAPDPSDDADEDDGPLATFFPDGQVVVGDRRVNEDFEVPSAEEGWVVKAPRDQRGYVGEDADGDTLRALTYGPAEWNPLTCTDDYGFKTESPRAWVGFTEPAEDDGEDGALRRTAEDVTGSWRSVLTSTDGPAVSRPRYSDATISDGTPALRSSFTLVPDEGVDADECGAYATVVTFLTVDTGDYLATLVLARYVDDDGSDTRGGLPSDVAEQILASPRLQEEP